MLIMKQSIGVVINLLYYQMKLKQVCTLAILYSTIKAAIITNLTGSINSSTSPQYFSYNTSTDDRILSAIFRVTNVKYSNTFIYVSFTPAPTNLTTQLISLYLQTNSPTLNYMDPISAIGGSTQIINLNVPTNATFYITIFDLDGPQIIATKDYQMRIYLSIISYYCIPCPSGTSIDISQSSFLCQCAPCPANYIGKTCQYRLNKLTASTTLNLTYNQSKYFVVDSTGQDIKLTIREITNISKVYLYVQYQFNNRLIAGKLNSYQNGRNTSFQYLITNNQKIVNIPSNGFNVLLTLQSYSENTSTITIVYNNSKSQNSRLLVIAICVSILGTIAIIIIVLLIRRKCCVRAIINVNSAVIIDQNNLTNNQIDRFFPQALAFTIFILDINSSMSEVNINNQYCNGEQIILQCSICFDSIKRNDFIRVTYCRHVFHSKCLIQWFHKNPICPNCRQQFNEKTTKQFRAKIPKSVKKSKANNLIKAILGDNYLEQYKKKSAYNPTELENKKINEVQIQSKNLNIQQNQQQNPQKLQQQ